MALCEICRKTGRVAGRTICQKCINHIAKRREARNKACNELMGDAIKNPLLKTISESANKLVEKIEIKQTTEVEN